MHGDRRCTGDESQRWGGGKPILKNQKNSKLARIFEILEIRILDLCTRRQFADFVQETHAGAELLVIVILVIPISGYVVFLSIPTSTNRFHFCSVAKEFPRDSHRTSRSR